MDLYLIWLEQQTHNMDVLGSSPSWSTLRIKQLSRKCLTAFFVLGNMPETTNSSLQKECIIKEQHRNSSFKICKLKLAET